MPITRQPALGDEQANLEAADVERQEAGIDDIPGSAGLIVKTFKGPKGFIIKQNAEVAEILAGVETANSYQIMDELGNNIATAEESTNFCCRHCCRGFKRFSLKILKGMVLVAEVKSNKDVCFFGQRIKIYAPDGGELGQIVKECQIMCCCNPDFFVHDRSGQILYKINSPCSLHYCTCCRDIDFKISSTSSGEEVGIISRKAQDLAVQTMTDIDTYFVRLHKADLPPLHKMLIMCAGFAIDFAFYEDNAGKKM